jgi:hypothetical protein
MSLGGGIMVVRGNFVEGAFWRHMFAVKGCDTGATIIYNSSRVTFYPHCDGIKR